MTFCKLSFARSCTIGSLPSLSLTFFLNSSPNIPSLWFCVV
ncbi:hypothetical protein TVAGG3_0434600, partial [Trichomonas vaginalis G3]